MSLVPCCGGQADSLIRIPSCRCSCGWSNGHEGEDAIMAALWDVGFSSSLCRHAVRSRPTRSLWRLSMEGGMRDTCTLTMTCRVRKLVVVWVVSRRKAGDEGAVEMGDLLLQGCHLLTYVTCHLNTRKEAS